MKFYHFLAVALGCFVTLNGADDNSPKFFASQSKDIRIINNYGSSIDMRIETRCLEPLGNVTQSGSISIIEANKEWTSRNFIKDNLARTITCSHAYITSIGIRVKGFHATKYEPLNISGFDKHPDQQLVITITTPAYGLSLGGYAPWNITYDWVSPSERSLGLEGFEFVGDKTPYEVLGVPADASYNQILKVAKGASHDEILKRYRELVRLHRSNAAVVKILNEARQKLVPSETKHEEKNPWD